MMLLAAMEFIKAPSFEIPHWIQYFVVGGIALVIILVPLKIFWEMSRGTRERRRKLHEFADRLRERFNEVQVAWSILGVHRIRFKHEGRKVSVILPDDDELVVRLEENISPKFPCVIKTKGCIEWPWAFVGLRPLGRIKIFDSLLDESVLIYSTPVFGGYLREMALDAVSLEGGPKGITESIIILRKTPGVRRFRLSMSESTGFRVGFKMRTEDLRFRPDELEAVVHHALKLYDAMVLY
jgi:hypothetical protein